MVQPEKKKLEILMLCSKPLYPLIDGGCVGMHAIWQGLQIFGINAKILTAYSIKHPLRKEVLPSNMSMDGVFLNLKPSLFKALINLFSSHSYISDRFYSKEIEKKIKETFVKSTYDIVQIEGLYMAQYIPLIRKYSKAKIVVRPANVESEIWDRISKQKSIFQRWYYKILNRRIAKEEVKWLNWADMILPVTERDERIFKEMGVRVEMEALAVGVADTLAPVDIEPEFPSLFYIGAMNWQPNIEGIEWFIEKVWPEINSRFPDLKFYIAGRYMPERLQKSNYPQLVVMGEIEDAKMFMASKAIMVVPVLSGSGIRIKIIEGMVAARPVITTSIGAEGIDYVNGENILIADTVQDFIQTIAHAVQNKQEMENIGANGRSLVLKNHNIEKITEKLIQLYNI